MDARVLQKWSGLSDAEVVAHVVAGRTALFEVLMRRYEERLYRVCRAIAADGTQAEALVVDAFIEAYSNLHRFDATTPFAIWLTQLAVRTAASPRLEPLVVGRATEPDERKERPSTG
jgi:RNA polymerase sigma-70 factor (ECF subfamily)